VQVQHELRQGAVQAGNLTLHHHEAGTGTQDPNVPISRLFNGLERACAQRFVSGMTGA
jgi:hypothetical protein